MNHLADDAPPWPAPSACLDDRLDIDNVMATTGCTAEDFADLSAIFVQEIGNMNARLQRAVQALETQQGTEQWPQAVELLRTAAHELTTSFGIVGAKRAECYSRHTQLRVRKGSALADPPPSAQELLTAAQGLLGGVQRVGELLKAPG